MRDALRPCGPSFKRLLPAMVGAALLMAAHAGVLAQAPPARGVDPMKSPACVEARHALDAAEAALKPGQAPSSADLRNLRQKVANLCLRAEADTPSARVQPPPIAVPPVGAGIGAMAGVVPPRAPATPTITPLPSPTPPTGPTQVSRCDAGGCWDSNGTRLNRSGPFLVNPQGSMCTKVGTIVQCP